MTTKQIAEAVGQTDRSVRNWIAALAEKSSVIAEKLAASSSRYPADYTLDESCQIIEQGLGQAAADVYRTNAAMAESRRRETKVTHVTGALAREARLAVQAKILTADDFRRLLGLLPPVAAPAALPEPEEVASSDFGNYAFREIEKTLGLKAAKQIYGATNRITRDVMAKVEAERKQGHLELPGGQS